MHKAEAELKAEIDALLAKAKDVDEAEGKEVSLDLPAEIQRRESRLAVIQAAKARLEERQREADTARGRTPDDQRDDHGKPKRGPRHKRDFGVPEPKAQESFTDTDSRIMKRASGGFDQCYNAPRRARRMGSCCTMPAFHSIP